MREGSHRVAAVRLALLVLIVLLTVVPSRAAGRGEAGEVYPVRIELRDRVSDLKLLHELDLDIDGVFGTWARVYVIDEEIEKLRGLGIQATRLAEEIPAEAPGLAAAPQYHTWETLTSDLQRIAQEHAAIARLYSIGKSVQGRDLWIMKISKNPDVEEDEPEIRYIAAMHGDEVVGKEMCFNLIDLLTNSYGVDPRITKLVDESEIWILPSMNPDGTAAARRYNAQNIDLNRNFPDQFRDPVDTPDGRAVETGLVMNWAAGRSSILSANFHGGTLVANYPYDGTPTGESIYSLAPDDNVFVSVSRTYADNNPSMYASNSDPSYDHGICNGADWYHVNGGMQDWNYVWRGDEEVTLEISTVKWPSATQLPAFWAENQESMLAYLERARAGVRGIVTDAVTGAPLRATVRVLGSDRAFYADPEVGDFHRLLLPGRYDLEVSATGYSTSIVRDVVVEPVSPATRADVALEPLAVDLQPASARVLDGGNGALDPGETADLAVTIQDLGQAASTIGATLVPTTWFATATRPEASYPDLAAGASGESLAPHHQVSVSADTPPGHKLGFALRWTADQGAGESEPFFLPARAPDCQTVTSTDVPKSILDRSTSTSALSVAGSGEIASVRVRTDIGHPYVGDLHVRVISPSGSPVQLHARTGGSADDIVGWFPGDRTPAEPLSRLTGENAAGTWTLEVHDGVPLNTGTLRGWSLEVCTRSFEATTPEMMFRDVRRAPNGAVLTWWPYPGLTSYRVYRSTSPADRASFTDVTSEDPDPTDTRFHDASAEPVLFYLVTGVGPSGEGPRGDLAKSLASRQRPVRRAIVRPGAGKGVLAR